MSHEPDTPASLAELLRAEAAVFDELADLAVRQRRALLDADEDRLLALAGQAETLATRFQLIEDERARVERIGSHGAEDDPRLTDATAILRSALSRLLRETAVSGAVLERLGDTVAARQAAVGALFGTTYLSDGRRTMRRASGAALCAEG